MHATPRVRLKCPVDRHYFEGEGVAFMNLRRGACRGLNLIIAIVISMAWCRLGAAQSDQFVASDTIADDRFGFSLAVEGDLVLVGARETKDVGTDSGAVYVMRRTEPPGGPTQWVQEAKLLPSGLGIADSYFGNAVAIDGDVIVVGATHDDEFLSNAGAAYVFRYNDLTENWDLEAKLHASDAASSDHFGISVAIRGDELAVASEWHDAGGVTNTGAAYVFRYDSMSGVWNEEQKFVPPVLSSGADYGRGLAFSDQGLVISEPWSDFFGDGLGAVFVYVHDGAVWNLEQSIGPNLPGDDDGFGQALSIDGNRMAVVAVRYPIDGYIAILEFDGSLWQRVDTVTQCVDSSSSWRNSVCLRGDWLLAGRSGDYRAHEQTITQVGSAYAYHYNGAFWDMEEFFYIADGMQSDRFGSAVALIGDEALISAPDRDDYGDGSGLVYVFTDLSGTDYVTNDCNANGLNDRCEISDGLVDDCNGNAIPDTCDLALGYREDCDLNGVPDSCDIDLLGDCNGNAIPDACDIQSGFAVDCDGNGVIDMCEIDDYSLDDGDAEFFINAFAGIEFFNQFAVNAGEEEIVAIHVAWPTQVSQGVTVRLRLFDDPNNDGNPVDRVQLAEIETVTFTSGEPLTWVRLPIPPTIVGAAGDSFFVSQHAASSGVYMSSDGTSPQMRSWYSNSGATPLIWETQGWILRADATHPAAIPEACLIVGDSNGDGLVGVIDFLAVLSNWGPCPSLPAGCPADSDGDDIVGINDFLNVLFNWS